MKSKDWFIISFAFIFSGHFLVGGMLWAVSCYTMLEE